MKSGIQAPQLEVRLSKMYTAKQGDIIWLDFDPQAGHEQKGRRPAVVVSNDVFNGFTQKAALVCPVTSNDRGIPHHLALDERTKTNGVVLTDQAKILDISKRNAEFIEVLPKDFVLELVDTLYGFIYTA